MCPDDVTPAPARIGLDVLAQRVLALDGLVHGVDHAPTAAGLPPLRFTGRARRDPDRTALHLQHHDADDRQEDHEVGLVVLLRIDDPEVGHQQRIAGQGVPQLPVSYTHLTLPTIYSV